MHIPQPHAFAETRIRVFNIINLRDFPIFFASKLSQSFQRKDFLELTPYHVIEFSLKYLLFLCSPIERKFNNPFVESVEKSIHKIIPPLEC